MSKIRPYTKEEAECYHLEVVKSKFESRRGFCTASIIGVFDDGVCICGVYYSFDDFLKLWTWNDGSPCGIEEDEE